MTPSARLSASMEILTNIETARRPAADAIRDWGFSHRFAGSKDRSAVSDLVYDALRVKASAAWIMGEETSRAMVIGSLRELRAMRLADVEALFSGATHAPAPLTAQARDRFENATLEGAPIHVVGNFPEWLSASLSGAFGDSLAQEAKALAARAPLDLRVNTLKAGRDKALKSLSHLHAQVAPFSPMGLRIAIAPDSRGPALNAEPAYVKGLVEVQDEGSQITALLSGARAGNQVLDLCAGGGGKTLAMAAMMENRGQIYATDTDGRRLMPIFARLERAGVRNVQVRAPKGSSDVLSDLEGRCDIVFIDAPCTGIGTWRRNPDAKWRIRPGALDQRLKEQDLAIQQGLRFVKPGGRLIYVTCSMLREENEDRMEAALAQYARLLPLDATRLAVEAGIPRIASCASKLGPGLRLSPYTTRTDGFFVAGLLRV